MFPISSRVTLAVWPSGMFSRCRVVEYDVEIPMPNASEDVHGVDNNQALGGS